MEYPGDMDEIRRGKAKDDNVPRSTHDPDRQPGGLPDVKQVIGQSARAQIIALSHSGTPRVRGDGA
jgi:hypothetical protein